MQTQFCAFLCCLTIVSYAAMTDEHCFIVYKDVYVSSDPSTPQPNTANGQNNYGSPSPPSTSPISPGSGDENDSTPSSTDTSEPASPPTSDAPPSSDSPPSSGTPSSSDTPSSESPASFSPKPLAGAFPKTATITWYKKATTVADYKQTACGQTLPECKSLKIPLVAASENYFGVGPGAGAGPLCGKCFLIHPKINIYSKKNIAEDMFPPIKVKVADLCGETGGAPSDNGETHNSEWCRRSKSDPNAHGQFLHFDLMVESLEASDVTGAWKKGMENTNYIADVQPVEC